MNFIAVMTRDLDEDCVRCANVQRLLCILGTQKTSTHTRAHTILRLTVARLECGAVTLFLSRSGDDNTKHKHTHAQNKCTNRVGGGAMVQRRIAHRQTNRRTRFAVGSLEFAGNPHRWHCNAAMEKQKRQLKLAHSANKLGSCNLKKYMCCTTRQLHGIISIRFNLLTKSTGIYIR